MDLSSLTTLRLEREGPVGWLRLHRPERLNSFTLEMWNELRALGEALLADPGDLRALVVIGEGRAFSSGIDTSLFSDGSVSDEALGSASQARPLAQPVGKAAGMRAGLGKKPAPKRHDDPVVDSILTGQDAYTWLEEAPFATIAAIRGYALGAGLQLALACDIRMVAEGTQLGLLEFKYGIIPDLGGTQRLPRLVGAGKAKELIFTAARIDAEEAMRIGIAERVVREPELEQHASELAGAIAAQPPLAVRGAKRAVNFATQSSVRDGLRVEAENQAICLRSDDMKEAIAAFVEQRPPQFHGR